MRGYKIVADTNILISAILRGGIAHKFFQLSNKYQVELVCSKGIFQKLDNVLQRKFDYPEKSVRKIIDTYASFMKMIDVTVKCEVRIRDVADIPILETALSAKADFLVTGDKDLLELKNIEHTKIVSLREIIDILEN